MAALDPPPSPRLAQLAEALMSAVTELSTTGAEVAFRPSGSPVRSGRVHLGRARRWLPAEGPFTVAVGFARAAWIGAPGQRPPAFGAMTYRSEVAVDDRGRLVLDRRARAWLHVADPAAFDVVVMPVESGGVLLVPTEGFGRRWLEVTS